MSKIIDVMTANDLNRLKNMYSPKKIQNGTSVMKSGIFAVIHQDYGIGRLRSGQLVLTPRDLRQIRKIIKELSGFDILNDAIPNTRIEMAKYFPNEKLSRSPVKDKVIKLYGVLSTNINGKRYDLEDSMNIEIPLSRLESIEHVQIVIVENYEAFSTFRAIQSDIDPNPLVIYRGDKEVSVISNEIALKFPHAELVTWFDTDPKGISLALACGANKMLIPELSEEELSMYGRAELFDAQYKNWQNVFNAIPQNLKEAMSKTGKGITQEAIIAHQIPLISHLIKMDQ